MAGLDLYREQEDGTYQITRVRLRPELQSVIHSDKLKQSFTLLKGPIFPQVKPQKVNSWEDVLEYELEPTLNVRKTMMHVYNGEFWPISWETPTRAEVQNENSRFLNYGVMNASEKASQQQLGNQLVTGAFLLIVGVIVLMVLIIAVGFLPTVLRNF